jgi:hypothetical protein
MAAVEPEGGDPACWLDHVCPECGRFVDRTDDHVCEQAGAPALNPPAS